MKNRFFRSCSVFAMLNNLLNFKEFLKPVRLVMVKGEQDPIFLKCDQQVNIAHLLQ